MQPLTVPTVRCRVAVLRKLRRALPAVLLNVPHLSLEHSLHVFEGVAVVVVGERVVLGLYRQGIEQGIPHVVTHVRVVGLPAHRMACGDGPSLHV